MAVSVFPLKKCIINKFIFYLSQLYLVMLLVAESLTWGRHDDRFLGTTTLFQLLNLSFDADIFFKQEMKYKMC